MTYRIALSFEDGVTRFITCAADQTVADASYRQRVNIPLDCRDGACGTCKALCESGEYDGGTYIEDALTADEAAAGYVLPCSMKPKSDLVLQIASTSAVAKTQAATFTGTITALERLTSTTVRLTVEIPDRERLAYLPGQYVNIAVPGTSESRSYSFSNAPDDKRLTFLVKLTPGGVMSGYLTERAMVGDDLTFTGPNGSFFLRAGDGPILLLAGGTGLAPILSIVRSLRDTGSSRPVHLIYGVSTDEDVAELQTLTDLAAQLDSFTWDYCVADPASSAPSKGYVTSLMRDEHLHDGAAAVYLCGPPAMVESVRKHLAENGIVPAGFYYEKFALSGTGTERSSSDAAVVTNVAETAAEASTAQSAPSAAAPVQVESVIDAYLHQAGPAVAESTAAPNSVEAVLGSGRAIAGQEIFPGSSVASLGAAAPTPSAPESAETIRSIAGQIVWSTGGGPAGALDPGDAIRPVGSARAVAGQQVLPPSDDIAPLVEPTVLDAVASYEIGEEHPPVHDCDAVFEARHALELGALEVTFGRLTAQQLSGYRLLAEATAIYLDGDRFVDAAAFTEANSAFHEYLFTLTGNAHLLEAYRALGVTGRMEETLRNATWCDPRCAQDHLDLVAAFEAGDRQLARRLIIEHSERSKVTMRRAMADAEAMRRPRFISPGRFDGKVVLVTGAAQGIGAATARRISAEGGSVVLVDRSDLVFEVADELTDSGGDVLAVTADLETGDGATHAVAQTLAQFGRIDVLINNVGGAIWFKPFVEFSEAEIRTEITRSLMTTMLCTHAALPHMLERRSGVIVNVSSCATRGIHRIPYSAAKGGVNALTASLALEYADAGIRVVATAPGGTAAPARRISRGGSSLETEQERVWFQAHIDQTLASSPMKRYGTLDEQAAAITFLASDEASYITGVVLPVAGGDLG
ncbi:benzoate 1,2-dioxygenase electron transfer component BenC [Nocardia sp. R6R-6]|uniref:benzoate 1,2-dioxygenase electron transfer component BenC n=1 Tax=Nocardia sp. R6R-6 TaxID=3459303 RepID=UPI00403E3404